MLRCLVCYSDLPSPQKVKSKDEIRTGQNCSKKSLLSKHLDVIFILRNIFQVPITQLSNYLKNCPKVDNWICICEKCDELVTGYRAIYNDMLDISRKIEEAKGGIIQIVKKSYENPGSEETPVFLNITDECRRLINNYEYQRPINPFTDGDLKALQLWKDKNSISAVNQDKPVHVAFPISKNSRTTRKTKPDLSFTTTTNSTSPSYPNDDDDTFSNDGFDEPDNFNSDDNEDDDFVDTRRLRPSSYLRHHKETSKEWKVPSHLKSKEPEPEIKLECPHCPTEIFTNKTQLVVHFKDNHPHSLPPKQRKYPPEYYTISDNRKRRIRSRVPSQCPYCPKKLTSRDGLNTHIRFTHLLKFPFHCGSCGLGRPTQKALDSHEALCSKIGPPTNCPEEGCPVVVPIKVGLETHFRDKHSERSLFSRCPECKEGFYTKLGFERHLQKEHSETRPFTCDECGMSFKSNPYLRYHKKKSHGGSGGGRMKVICDICGGSFASQNYLREHVKGKHENEYKLRCDQCGRGYTEGDLLAVHLFKEHGIGRVEDMKWRCGVEGCGKIFYRKGGLDDHTRLSHGEEGEKGPEFTCEECGKQFGRKQGLVYHRKGIHESKLNKERFKCELCGAEFGFKDYLTRHKRTVHKIFPRK